MSTTTDLQELKINYLTQAQYDAAKSGGTVNENEIYMTPATGGGTSDYTDLFNKPQINSNTLTGNKTSANLGLQDTLVSGTNIKTINNQSLLGSGNISIAGGDYWEDVSNQFSSILTGSTYKVLESDLFWQISSSDMDFNNGFIQLPMAWAAYITPSLFITAIGIDLASGEFDKIIFSSDAMELADDFTSTQVMFSMLIPIEGRVLS